MAPSAALAGFALIIAWRPQWWLPLLLMALPGIGLAAWTGWLYVEELDLALLVALGMGYLGLRRATPRARSVAPVVALGLGSAMILLLLSCSYAISAIRGALPLSSLQVDPIATYDSHLNSLRIVKSYVFALLALPLLYRELLADGQQALRRLCIGMAGGLAVVSLLGLWERLAFTGLLDLSSEYRITALFWETHTGGAALDGYLGLAIPFAVWALVRARTTLRTLMAGALFALAGYVALVTFSRGVYAAYVISLAALAWRLSAAEGPGRANGARFDWRHLVALVVTAWALFAVFGTGGYRTLAAALGFLAASAFVGDALRSSSWRLVARGALVSLALIAASGLAFAYIPKGAYLAYALLLLGFAACAVVYARMRSAPALLILVALYIATGVDVLLVAVNWGGPAAAPASGLVLALGTVLVAWNARGEVALWRWDRPHLIAGAAVAAVMSLGAVAMGSYYMSLRFDRADADLSGRGQHWRDSLAQLRTPADWVFGKGLGRFPSTYFWAVDASARPGHHQLVAEEGNAYLALSAPGHLMSGGNFYRVSQRVQVSPGEPLIALMELRAPQGARLSLEVCQKQLLYPHSCLLGTVNVPPGRDGWQPVRASLQGTLEPAPWYAPRLAFFSIAAVSRGGSIGVDNVALVGAAGHNLIHNGTFSEGIARWFFTSDRHHLPWHIKNLWLNFLFDQGIFGLVSFSLAYAWSLWRLTGGAARSHPVAPYLFASLTAFGVVGLFDSLVDVPRVAFLFYVLLFLGLFLTPRIPRAHA